MIKNSTATTRKSRFKGKDVEQRKKVRIAEITVIYTRKLYRRPHCTSVKWFSVLADSYVLEGMLRV